MNLDIAQDRSIFFAGNAIKVNTDLSSLLDLIDSHLKYCITEPQPVVAEYKLTVAGDNTLLLSHNDGKFFFKEILQVLFYLMQDGITRLNGAARLGPVIHAAALTHHDRGLILCGESGSGKSTLTAWLAAHGFGYLTDEVICVEGEEISGLPRSIVLKRGSAFVWQHWLGNPPAEGFLQFPDGTAWIDPTLFGADVCSRATPHTLIFPRYVPNAELHVEPLKPADALFRLMKGLVNARNFPDGGLAAASRLAKRVHAWQLTYSDLESATAWIQETLAD